MNAKKRGHDNAAGKRDVGHFIGAKSIRVQHVLKPKFVFMCYALLSVAMNMLHENWNNHYRRFPNEKLHTSH